MEGDETSHTTTADRERRSLAPEAISGSREEKGYSGRDVCTHEKTVLEGGGGDR